MLNAIFANLACVATEMKDVDHFERYMRLALEAQSQCRATCETLAVLKNPPVFMRQANVAAQQVVNNGTMVTASRARESETAPNELLEAHGDGWTDERRAEQAKAVWRWRLWEHSTGPRTAEGKARSSRNAYRGGHRQNERQAARLLAQLTPRIEAGDVEARAEIMRRILAGNVELFFRCVELASSETDESPRDYRCGSAMLASIASR